MNIDRPVVVGFDEGKAVRLDGCLAAGDWGPAGRERWRLAAVLHGEDAPQAFVPDLVLAGLARGCYEVQVTDRLGTHHFIGQDQAQLITSASLLLPVSALGLPALDVFGPVNFDRVRTWDELLREQDDVLGLDEVVRRYLPSVGSSASSTVDELLASPLNAGGPPRVLELLWQHRPDLQEAFPDLRSADYDAFLDWSMTQGQSEAGLSTRWLASTYVQRPSPPRCRRRLARTLKRVALVRLTGSKGVAQAATTLGLQLESRGVLVEQFYIDPLNIGLLDTGSHDAVIFAINGDLLERVVRRTRHAARARLIAYWWWETTALPGSYRRASQLVHAIWAPTDFVHKVLIGQVETMLETVPPPVSLHPTALEPVDEQKPFTFLVVADADSSTWRKNPSGALAAYIRAFPDIDLTATKLILKMRNASGDWLAGFGRDRADVEVVEDEFTADEQAALIQSCHALVSLHRSEGFGLALAEALDRGKLVIASSWGGSETLAGHAAFWKVPCELALQEDPTRSYRGASLWAEPSIEAAARLLRQAVRERHRVGDWAQTGRQHMAGLRQAAQRHRYRA